MRHPSLLVFLLGFAFSAPSVGSAMRFQNQVDTPTENVLSSLYSADDHELNPDPKSDFWKTAPSVVLDKTILGELDPPVRSEARSRWTKTYLYFLFWGPYEYLHLKPDPDTVHETWKLWFYDDFELYLGSNYENINLYGEFQISPQSEFLDQAIDATRDRPGWNDEHLWDSGMTVKSRIDAEHKIWYGEMRIPVAAIDKRPVKAGNEFRVNVYRLQYAGEGKKIHFLAWQPTGEWNPHRPKKFGTLKLIQ
jgi:Carbohydrate family 9 binding domain-like